MTERNSPEDAVLAALEARDRVLAARNNLLAAQQGRLQIAEVVGPTIVLLDQAASWLSEAV